MKDHLVLVSLSGPDRPGIISSCMKVIAQHQVRCSDVGQSVTHGWLSLNLVLVASAHQQEVFNDLRREAEDRGLSFHHREIHLHPHPTVEKYILSCVATGGLTPQFLADVTELLSLHQINIRRIDNLTEGNFKSLDISATSERPLNWERVKVELMDVSNRHGIDTALLRDDAFRSQKRLIVFDMDSTLIEAEVIDEMAVIQGIDEKVKLITKRAMDGEMDFDQSLRERVALLKGMHREKLDDIYRNLRLTPGTEKFIQTVKGLGLRTAIISGGFRFFAENLQRRLGMDYAFANDLEFEDDVLTGKVTGEIINATKKATILEELARKEGIGLEQVVAVGDGANDLLMLAKAGLGIAFHAKEKVRKEARHQMSHGPMTSILYFLGVPGNHLP